MAEQNIARYDHTDHYCNQRRIIRITVCVQPNEIQSTQVVGAVANADTHTDGHASKNGANICANSAEN